MSEPTATRPSAVTIPWTLEQGGNPTRLEMPRLPPDMAELGEPVSVHHFENYENVTRNLLIGGAVLLVCVVVSGFKAAGLLLGFLLAAGTWWVLDKANPRSGGACLMYRQALASWDGKTITIIPWGEVHDTSGGGFFLHTADGQKHSIGMADDKMYHTVTHMVEEVNLPPILDAIGRGEAVPIGDYQVSAAGLGYKGHFVGWDEVSSLTIMSTNGLRTFRVWRKGGLLPWGNGQLTGMVGEVLFLGAVKRVCPPRLLVLEGR